MSKYNFGSNLQGSRGHQFVANDDVNFGLVLVVGRSPVNNVVVAKIVERAGLRSAVTTPDGAVEIFVSLRPGTVVIDGGSDNSDYDAILSRIELRRSAVGRGIPCVILLSTRNSLADGAPPSPIDAIVAKPFTPESLQPVVERLLHSIRG